MLLVGGLFALIYFVDCVSWWIVVIMFCYAFELVLSGYCLRWCVGLLLVAYRVGGLLVCDLN